MQSPTRTTQRFTYSLFLRPFYTRIKNTGQGQSKDISVSHLGHSPFTSNFCNRYLHIVYTGGRKKLFYSQRFTMHDPEKIPSAMISDLLVPVFGL